MDPLEQIDIHPPEDAPPPRAGTGPALAARGIRKVFPGVVANAHVDFELAPGEVHALLGENGSGKTTLCKVLTGLYRPDGGHVVVDGRRVDLSSPADAYAAGVFMVHQHFSLVEQMTVAENIVLGWSRERQRRFDRRNVEREVAAAAERYHMHVDPSAPVWRLSVGERQRVEILKVLYHGARTLILDEPTTVLTPQESELLFVSLRRMADAGGSVVFISHKLDEVASVCDRVTVLRQGRSTGTVDLRSEQLDAKGLARLMVGREIQLGRRARHGRRPPSAEVLAVRGVTVRDEVGFDALKDVSLTVRAGEILGIAGVAGNGQRELADAICGLRSPRAGEVLVDGRAVRPGDVRAATAAGIAYVPEDRMGTGLAPGLPVADNIVLKAYRSRTYSSGPFLSPRRILERTNELLERFNVKGTAQMPIRQLSGGNAQKVLLAREMSSQPRVLVIAAPTRGLDVSAIEGVRSILMASADSGIAVVMISEDLDEVLDLADRVAVMCHGEITGLLDADGADVEEIGLLMMGRDQTKATA
jgi:general nucleoside transport system ATP-binding protein